jgi:hypothetical protein
MTCFMRVLSFGRVSQRGTPNRSIGSVALALCLERVRAARGRPSGTDY